MKKFLSLTLVLAITILSSCSNSNKIVMTMETEKNIESTVEKTFATELKEQTTEMSIVSTENQSVEEKVVENNNGRDDMKPVVYFTKNITADSLVKIYESLGWTPTGKVGVKISTGEPPRSNYLRTELIGDLVKKLMEPS